MPRRRQKHASIGVALALVLGACEDDPLVTDDVGEAPYCEHLGATTVTDSRLEQDLFDAVNEARRVGARCGQEDVVPALPLALIPELRCAARSHARDQAVAGTLSHEGSDGSTPLERTTVAGYDGLARQELLAGDFEIAEDVVAAWLADETHCRALLDADLEHGGPGRAMGNSGADIAWVFLTGDPFD